MEKTLLTKVVTQLVNERANAQEYGVALVNIPDFVYVPFALGLSSERTAALFFLGFPESTRARIESELSQNESLSYDFTVEKAEESRNSGDESIFRVLVIKRAEMEKCHLCAGSLRSRWSAFIPKAVTLQRRSLPEQTL